MGGSRSYRFSLTDTPSVANTPSFFLHALGKSTCCKLAFGRARLQETQKAAGLCAFSYPKRSTTSQVGHAQTPVRWCELLFSLSPDVSWHYGLASTRELGMPSMEKGDEGGVAVGRGECQKGNRLADGHSRGANCRMLWGHPTPTSPMAPDWG